MIAFAFLVGLSLGLFSSVDVSAQQARTLQLNYKRIEIQELLTRVAEANERTVLFDDQLRGSVSIVAKRPVTYDEAWALLESALSMLGFSLLPSTEGNYRVSKVAEAVGEAPFQLRPRSTGESYVTTLIPLEVASLPPIMKVLEPLSGSRVTLVAFPPTNSVIASGPERAIARLTQIADELDRVANYPLRLRVLRYRDVDEAEPLIEAHLASLDSSGQKLEVWTDRRTNSVVYRGPPRENARFARILDGYDEPVVGDGEFRILRARNRDPEELANLIRGRGAGGDAPASPSPEPEIDRSGDAAGRDEGDAEDLSLTPPRRSAPADLLSESSYSIVVDQPTRSLIVRGNLEAQLEVQALVEQLDRQPELIAVDVTVTELRTPSQWALDFGFLVPLASGNDAGELIATLASSSGTGSLLGTPSDQSTVFGRVTRQSEVPFLIDDGTGTEIPVDYNATFEGVDRKVRAEVLFQPSLIVASGEEQELFAGINVPVPVTNESAAESSALVASGLARSTDFQRKDVGINLALEATAGREGKIRLDLDVELSALIPSIAGSIEQVGPSFVEERLIATAYLEDGETALLAIDREQQEIDVFRGTPFLSTIPFLGFLFTGKAKSIEDMRLIIAAKARRVSSPSQLVADTIRRRIAFERANSRSMPLPSTDGEPYAVRVTTRSRLDDAEAISEGLSLKGLETEIHRWTDSTGDARYDVYVVSFESLANAAGTADDLSQAGWETELVILPTEL